MVGKGGGIMLQTIIVALFMLLDAIIVRANVSAPQSWVSVAIPWRTEGLGLSVTPVELLGAAAAAIVVVLFAGFIDRSVLERRVLQREVVLRTVGSELMRTKTSSYDKERIPLDDVRVRLDTIEREVRAIRSRLDREPAGAAGSQRAAS